MSRKAYIDEAPTMAQYYFETECGSNEEIADSNNCAALKNAVLAEDIDEHFKAGDKVSVIWDMNEARASFYHTADDLENDESLDDWNYDWSTFSEDTPKQLEEHAEEIEAIDVGTAQVCRTYEIRLVFVPIDTPETLARKRLNLKRKLWIEKREQEIENAKTPEEKKEEARVSAALFKRLKIECPALF